jgi:hypothetical protein
VPHNNLVEYDHPSFLKWPFGLFRAGEDIAISPETALAVYVDSDVSLPVVP